jgi:hypothetical protein
MVEMWSVMWGLGPDMDLLDNESHFFLLGEVSLQW